MNVSVLICDFVRMRMKRTVGSYDSVAAERIVRRIEIVEVTSVDKDMVRTVFLRICRPQESLIHEIPDESALELRIFADKVPILLESSERITHRMRIFAEDERPRLV